MESVSIIIPAWNEAKVLSGTVEALLDIDYDKQKCEIIVVAGGPDNTYEIARELSPTMHVFLRYVVIHQLPGGKNSAIQQGVNKAKHNIIVLLDADTIVSEEWLKSMILPIEKGDADLTTANPYPIRRNWVSAYYMAIKTCLLDDIAIFSGHSMAFKADVVKASLDYFFDKDTKVGVDYLLAKRFLGQGRKVLFVERAHITTHFPSTVKYFVRCELRWLTALISIDGVSCRRLASNIAVVMALVLIIPLSKVLSVLSLIFHATYLTKRVRMFLFASRGHDVNVRNILGFIILSYACHIIGFASYIRYFAGWSKENYLCQGQRD